MSPRALRGCTSFLLELVAASPSTWAAALDAARVLDLVSRRELFVDEFLVAEKMNLELKLHSTLPRGGVMVATNHGRVGAPTSTRLSARGTSSGCFIWRGN